MIDIALTLDKLLPQTKYGGAFEFNTKEEYDALRWEDSRPKPTWEQIQNEWVILSVELKKQDCKDKAKQLLAQFDWTQAPDVNLTNKSEFATYREKLRDLVFNPVDNPVWPVEPEEKWG